MNKTGLEGRKGGKSREKRDGNPRDGGAGLESGMERPEFPKDGRNPRKTGTGEGENGRERGVKPTGMGRNSRGKINGN